MTEVSGDRPPVRARRSDGRPSPAPAQNGAIATMSEILARMRETGLLDEPSARRVQGLVAEGRPLDEALLAAGGLPEDRLLRYLSEEFHVPYVDLEQHPPQKEFLAQFPARILLEHRLLPLRQEDGVVTVASNRLFDTSGLDELRLASGLEFRVALAPSAEITRCIKGLLGVGADTLQSLVSETEDEGVQVVDREADEDTDLSAAAQDASIIKFVNQVLAEAIDRRATDVHVEPFEDALRVRYRVDGILQEANIPPEVRQFHPAIVSRLKILSRLDIAEKRLPQDGRIRLKVAGREVDVRVSVIPMLHGEAVVLRLLDRGAMLLGLEHLGMGERDRAIFERLLALPHGIILVTGPTGSGKTTTLYAGLSRINDVSRKIVTIEDPIEYHLRGINQIQVSTKAGLSFARGLRSILRHDPDVILVGEIRDRETADIAVQASLTGHLVFSTLHTNDAPGALTRLVDMGIEPYLVASSLEAVLAQRLVRLICPHCKESFAPNDMQAMRREFGDEAPQVLYRGRGCRECQGTGYRGRTGIFETMRVTTTIRTMILERASAGEIRHVAATQGMKSLREDGWRLVRSGRTTLEEVLRVTKDERASAGGEPDADLAGVPPTPEDHPYGKPQEADD
ncbi:MAG TPA: type II secretion system ATPase GspE [Phycisphaerae bacterium]|nr:type II secretion system ATPase GspE [Phycisphaerae bacterium]